MRFPFNQLPRAARERFVRALATPPILAEPSGTSSGLGWSIAAVFAVLGLGLFGWLGVGIVRGNWSATGVWTIVPYTLLSAALAGSLLAAHRCRARRTLVPWAPGRYLFPFGFVDARGPLVVMRPLGEIADLELVQDSNSMGIAVTHTTVRFTDNTSETFIVYGMRSASIAEAIKQLYADREQVRAALSANDQAVIDRLEPLDAGELAHAARAGAREELGGPLAGKLSPLAAHAWKLGLVFGIAAGVLAQRWVLPSLSLHAADSARAWRALAHAYPYGWVQARTRAAIDARYVEARQRLAKELSPEARASFAALLTYLQQQDSPTVRVVVDSPPEAELDLCTEWLKVQAKALGAASVAPVVLHYQGIVMGGVTPGESSFVGALPTASETWYRTIFSTSKRADPRSTRPTRESHASPSRPRSRRVRSIAASTIVCSRG